MNAPDKIEQLVDTLKKTGLAANDDDAREIAERMLTKRETKKPKNSSVTT